jgi:hypothetical protein
MTQRADNVALRRRLDDEEAVREQELDESKMTGVTMNAYMCAKIVLHHLLRGDASSSIQIATGMSARALAQLSHTHIARVENCAPVTPHEFKHQAKLFPNFRTDTSAKRQYDMTRLVEVRMRERVRRLLHAPRLSARWLSVVRSIRCSCLCRISLRIHWCE